MYFNEATFSLKADFSEVKFLQVAHFNLTTFSQGVDFLRAEFSEVYFMGTIFEEEAKFSWAKFKDKAFFLPASDLKKVVFGGPSRFVFTHFLEEVIFQDVNLSLCVFLHSNIDRVDFRYCTFAEKGRRKNVLRDEIECDEKVEKNESDRKDYEHVRRLYLELKRNFEEKKDWNKAGDFHFGEMECRRQKMNSWWKRNILSLEALYFGLSGYGERPWRAFRILLEFVLILFPLLYILSEGKTITEYFTSLLDSLKVATLMRLGNPIEPNTGFWKSIVAVAELIVVPLQTALLALALRRKVKR